MRLSNPRALLPCLRYQDAWMVGSGAAIAADLLAVSVLISITRQLWDTRVAKKAKRTLQVSEYAHLKM